MALVKRIPYEEELKKNPDLKESDVQMLREWLSKQPHLPTITDSELALFLHSNYYRIEATKTTIDTYYTVRTHVPEFFSNRDPLGDKGLRQALKVGAYIPLTGKSKLGYKIIYCRLVDGDASHYVYNDNIKYFCMVIDLWLATEGTCDGHVILVDMGPVTFGHAGRLNPMGLKKFLYYLQEGMPVRLKGLHFMNTSSVMDIILNMMKPFMKKELMDVLHLHSSMESLEEYIPRSVLPSDFGGEAPILQQLQENQVKQIEEHRAWFVNEESTSRVNEHLRPGKQKNATDLFGVEGSFKKLDID